MSRASHSPLCSLPCTLPAKSSHLEEVFCGQTHCPVILSSAEVSLRTCWRCLPKDWTKHQGFLSGLFQVPVEMERTTHEKFGGKQGEEPSFEFSSRQTPVLYCPHSDVRRYLSRLIPRGLLLQPDLCLTSHDLRFNWELSLRENMTKRYLVTKILVLILLQSLSICLDSGICDISIILK